MTVNCKYHECDYEKAVLELLQNQGWQYTGGYDIHRKNDEILLKDDLQQYLTARYGIFSPDELGRIAGYVVGGEHQSLYNNMKTAYTRLMRGYTLHRDDDTTLFIEFFDMEDGHCSNNIFRAVNQFEVDGYKKRIPDIVLFINGIPVSVFELKNPADEDVSIADAYTQTHVRYCKDIPDLMRFDFINVISDGANTKYGSLFSDYEFYFVWKSTDGKDYAADAQGIVLTHTLIAGLFAPATLLRVLHDYIYFPDNSSTNLVILPKYYQYYGTEELFASILKAHRDGSGKGGTYWGATGCGKSYTMLFLTRRITTSVEMNKPTVILLTDRNDLDEQLSTTFENAKGYLVDDNTLCITSREMLRKKLFNIQSGGIFLMTIQKFSEGIQLLSPRSNIVCISDEAHRTQTNTEAHYKTVNGQTKKSYGFAKYLHDSLPNATYVGFTGTPVDGTIEVFGGVVDAYTMTEAVKDGITVNLVYDGRAAKVMLNQDKVRQIEEYYAQCELEGANEHQVEESQKAVAKMEVIIGDPDRLRAVAEDFIKHYETRVAEGATVAGKAMFVCSNRNIAYDFYKIVKELRPKWTEKKICDDGVVLSEKDKKELKPMEKIKLVMTRNKDDEKDLFDMLGTKEDRKEFDRQFKNPKSNFKIAIVVDMWLTGFDVPELDTIYIDKPIQQHTLIQTISRVNRVCEGKDKGLIVDYIGIKKNMNTALKKYTNFESEEFEGVEQSITIVKDQLEVLGQMFHNFNSSDFFNGSPTEQLACLNRAVEYVQLSEELERRFMAAVKRMKQAFNLCSSSEKFSDEDKDYIHFYCAVRSILFKLTKGDAPDIEQMNARVRKMLEGAIQSDGIEELFETGKHISVDIFSDEYMDKINAIQLPNTKIKILQRLLSQAIDEFKKVNKIMGVEFADRLKKVVDEYNNRRRDEAYANEVLDDVAEQLAQLLSELKTEKNSFKNMGIDYEEKAFYDILKAVSKKFEFEYPDDKMIELSKRIKLIVDDKSRYTDWSARDDIKANLQVDLILLLDEFGYPPVTIDDVYKEVLEQAENFKKYAQ